MKKIAVFFGTAPDDLAVGSHQHNGRKRILVGVVLGWVWVRLGAHDVAHECGRSARIERGFEETDPWRGRPGRFGIPRNQPDYPFLQGMVSLTEVHSSVSVCWM